MDHCTGMGNQQLINYTYNFDGILSNYEFLFIIMSWFVFLAATAFWTDKMID